MELFTTTFLSHTLTHGGGTADADITVPSV